MKGRVFGLIVLTAIGIGILSYFGYMGNGDPIQLRGHYVKYTCGDDNLDIQVTAVNDSSLMYLIGKTVSPEIAFSQSVLNSFVTTRLTGADKTGDFFLVGSLKDGPVLHCSGSLCFKVKKIKSANENTFTEF